MKEFETKPSTSQLEVWEWKEKAAESVAHLPVGERIKAIMERTKQTVAELEKEGKLIVVKRPNKRIRQQF